MLYIEMIKVKNIKAHYNSILKELGQYIKWAYNPEYRGCKNLIKKYSNDIEMFFPFIQNINVRLLC